MKHIFFALFALPIAAGAAPFDLLIQQRNIADTATFTRTAPLPALNTPSLLGVDQFTNLPMMISLSQPLGVINGQLMVSQTWSDILNKPVFATVATSGDYNDLTNKPSGSQVNADWSASSGPAEIFNKPALFSGAYADLSGKPSLFSGAYSDLSGKPALAAVATSGAYADLTGKPTQTVNNSPGRSLVSTTASTGFQISATRNAQACYEGSFSTTSTIGGPSAASVFLETADTNSTTPGDWTTIGKQTYSNTITLAIVLNQVQGNNWAICRYIPAGKFVRIRSGSISGTASVSINAEQQEVLQ